MTVPDYRLPEHIERGSGFGPTFKNVIQEAISGNEQRFAQWGRCRSVGSISYGLQDSADRDGTFQAILAMWRAHYGSLRPFRFRDWSDYQATNEVFGTGDGTTRAFQLTRTYDPSLILTGLAGSLFYVREIILLASTPVIKDNNVVTTAYTISSSGLVTFTSAPANTHQLTWSGEFDVPVRFDTDQLPVIMNEGNIIAINALSIKEVLGEA
jgi:uncharacterized protein (TIGR02217 family)